MNKISLNFTKVALFFALPSSAVVLYLLWKQSKLNEEPTDIDFGLRTRQTVIEIKVPNDCVGAIIGPEGANIKEIQKNTGARITFKKPTDESEERTLLIRGFNINAQKAELEIRRLISEKPSIINDNMVVPKDSVGRLIGRSGCNIKQMCKISGCKIVLSREQVFSANNIPSHKVSLSGSIEQILHAKELISEKVKEEESFKKRKQEESLKRNSRSVPFSRSYPDGFSNSSGEGLQPTERFIISKIKTERLQLIENENNSYEIYVSAVANPQAFWVQLLNDDASKLDCLIDEMTLFYNDRKCDQDLYVSSYIHDLKIGDMICAQHNAAGWYRCEIKGIKKLSDEDYDYEFDIYYVDFGDSAYIKSFEARMLLERFNELPCYGIQCTLNGVEPIEDDFWSNEAVDFFEDVTHSCKWVVLNAKLIASKEEFNKTIPIVSLFDPKAEIDITTALIEKGLAQESNMITKAF